MFGVPTSTSSRRAGKKGFSRATPTGHVPKTPGLWATPNSRRGSRAGGLEWGGLLRGCFQLSATSNPSFVPVHAAGTGRDACSTRTPVTQQPPPRPASRISPPHTPPFTRAPPPPLGHTLHAQSVTVARSRAHGHDSRPPARRPKRGPRAPPRGPAQQRSPPGPDLLLRTGHTRSAPAPSPRRSGRVLTAHGPLGSVVPTGTPAS